MPARSHTGTTDGVDGFRRFTFSTPWGGFPDQAAHAGESRPPPVSQYGQLGIDQSPERPDTLLVLLAIIPSFEESEDGE